MPVLTTDTMIGRTVASGWGTASDGVSTWAGTGTPIASVGSSEAQFITASPNQFPFQYVNNKTCIDTDIVARVSIGISGNVVYLFTRMQAASPNNLYRATLTATNFSLQKVVSGTTTTFQSSTSTQTPASFYWIRLRTIGSTLSTKFWLDGTSEPANFQLTATDSTFTATGNYGVGATLATTTAIKVDTLTASQFITVSAARSTFVATILHKIPTYSRFLLNFQVPQPNKTYTIASDNFIRSNQSGWGTASDRESWSFPGGLASDYSISTNKGVIATTVGTHIALIGTGITNTSDHLVRIVPSASSDFVGFTFAYVNSTNYCYTEVVNGAARIYKVVGGVVTQVAQQTISITGGTAYQHHLKIVGNVASLYVWVDGGTQSGTPTVQATDTSFGLTGRYGLHAFLNNSADTIKYDNYSVTATPNWYYVSPIGSDSNPGTQGSPFLTIQKAANVVKSGDTIYIQPGTYTQQLTTSASGTPTAPISYLSTSVYGALIRTTGVDTIWTNTGDYVTFSQFDISSVDPTARLGILNNGSYCRAQYNTIHDLQALNSGASGGGGIDHGNFSSVHNDTIGNLIYNIGAQSSLSSVHCIYHACQYGTIANNIVYLAEGWGIHMWHGASNVLVVNNLSFNNGAGGVVVGGVLGEGVGTNDFTVVANNIFMNNTGLDGAIVEIGSTGTHNQYLNNLIWQNANVTGTSSQIRLSNGLLAGGTINADPLLITFVLTGGGNYHLGDGSPAINAALSLYLPAHDFDRYSRLERHYDIGPYLYLISALFPSVNRRLGLFPPVSRRQSL